MQGHFIPPAPPTPLPQEHRYKLHRRCRNCLTDTYPVVCLGTKRLTQVQASRAVIAMAERLERPCHHCGSLEARLVSFFSLKTNQGDSDDAGDGPFA